MTSAEARAMVDALPPTWTGEDNWRVFRGVNPENDQQMLLMLEVAARPWRYPEHDVTARISLAYTPNEHGLPDSEAFTRMREWGEALEAGIPAPHRNVATETGNGERVLYFALTADNEAARAQIERALADWGDGAKAAIAYDPTWEAIPMM